MERAGRARCVCSELSLHHLRHTAPPPRLAAPETEDAQRKRTQKRRQARNAKKEDRAKDGRGRLRWWVPASLPASCRARERFYFSSQRVPYAWGGTRRTAPRTPSSRRQRVQSSPARGEFEKGRHAELTARWIEDKKKVRTASIATVAPACHPCLVSSSPPSPFRRPLPRGSLCDCDCDCDCDCVCALYMMFIWSLFFPSW